MKKYSTAKVASDGTISLNIQEGQKVSMRSLQGAMATKLSLPASSAVVQHAVRSAQKKIAGKVGDLRIKVSDKGAVSVTSVKNPALVGKHSNKAIGEYADAKSMVGVTEMYFDPEYSDFIEGLSDEEASVEPQEMVAKYVRFLIDTENPKAHKYVSNIMKGSEGVRKAMTQLIGHIPDIYLQPKPDKPPSQPPSQSPLEPPSEKH